MFKRILLPLDGSELAEKAVPYGVELGKSSGAELILFHVCGPEHRHFERMHEIYMDNIVKEVEKSISGTRSEDTPQKVTVKIEEGVPVNKICGLVMEENIDLIIMTNAGASGHKVGMLGNVANRISREVNIPVMLIKPDSPVIYNGENQLISRILLPLDGSDQSKLALPVGIELAVKLEIPITLFRMAHVIYAYGGEPAPFMSYNELNQGEVDRVRDDMAALEKELSDKLITLDSYVTSGTDAASEIIEVSKKMQASLIVMSTHRRSGLNHLVFGSVAEKVLRDVEIPLLLVHAGTCRQDRVNSSKTTSVTR
jgi:nucleotide-binding universal stress UspA family protein